MNPEDRFGVGDAHLVGAAVAEDPGVVDKDVDPPELVYRPLDRNGAASFGSDVGTVSDGAATGLADLFCELLSGRRVLTGSVERDTEVVNDHRRSARRESANMRPPRTVSRR